MRQCKNARAVSVSGLRETAQEAAPIMIRALGVGGMNAGKEITLRVNL
jgi:hypothetical protein